MCVRSLGAVLLKFPLAEYRYRGSRLARLSLRYDTSHFIFNKSATAKTYKALIQKCPIEPCKLETFLVRATNGDERGSNQPPKESHAAPLTRRQSGSRSNRKQLTDFVSLTASEIGSQLFCAPDST